MTSDTNTVDFLLDNFVGGGGVWQWTVFFMLMLVDMVSVMGLFLHLFTAYSPNHRCVINACENEPNFTWIAFAIPRSYQAKEFLNEGQAYDPCHTYEYHQNGSCTQDMFNTSTIVGCKSFVYDQEVFRETIVTKYDLVCDDEVKEQLLGTVLMVGLLIGSVISGALGDQFGRRKALFMALVILAPSVMAGGFCQSYQLYVSLRFLSCSTLPIVWINYHSLVMEMFSAKYRTIVGCFKQSSWPLAMAVLSLTSYCTRDWQTTHLIIGSVAFAAFIPLYLSSESIRWLLTHNREDEAVEVLQTIGKINGKVIAHDNIDDMKLVLAKIQSSSETTTNKSMPRFSSRSICIIFTMDYIKITMLTIAMWTTSLITLYTLALSSTRLKGNIFVNFVVTGMVDILVFTFLFFATSKLGRVRTVSLCFMMGAVACIIMAFTPKKYSDGVLITYLTAKFFASGAFTLTFMVSSELYPTNLRSTAMSVCSTVARVFSLCTPFVATLAIVWQPLPMLAIGLPLGLTGVIAAFILPDSSGNLPQSITEVPKVTKVPPTPPPGAKSGIPTVKV